MKNKTILSLLLTLACAAPASLAMDAIPRDEIDHDHEPVLLDRLQAVIMHQQPDQFMPLVNDNLRDLQEDHQKRVLHRLRERLEALANGTHGNQPARAALAVHFADLHQLAQRVGAQRLAYLAAERAAYLQVPEGQHNFRGGHHERGPDAPVASWL